jgi:serine/threonine protein kinase
MEIGNQVHHFREGEEHDVTREFSRNKLHLQEEKGKGFFGTVFKAQAYGITMPGEWTTVAVKMIRDNTEVNKRICASLRQEAKLLCDLGRHQHKHIVRLLGVCINKGVEVDLVILGT